MTITETSIPSVLLIEQRVFSDNRGWFFEKYSFEKYLSAGISSVFVQDNHSYSAVKGTLRGLHYQKPPMAQAKLISCIRGAILDVAVDIRMGSPTYLRHVSVELNAGNKHQLFIPKGFAHGFITLTDHVEVEYKVDNIYAPETECSIRYDDPVIAINWGLDSPFLSEKDGNAPYLHDRAIAFDFPEMEADQ